MNPERLLKYFERIAEAPDAVPRLRRFILDLAVRGKLVEQNPEDEPVSMLLLQVQAERNRRTKQDKSTSAQTLPDAGNRSFRIPEQWRWVRLGFITNVVMGQSPPGETYNSHGNGIPLINGPVEFSPGPFGLTFLNQYTTAPTKLCTAGDLLLCVRGSTTGRTNVAAFDACIGRGVAALQSLYADQFLRYFVWSWREQIIEMGRGIAFPSIGRKQVEDLPVPFPPLAEQHRIVAKVDELMALCDELEAAQQKRERRRDRLVAAILHGLNNGTSGEDLRQNTRFYLNHVPSLTTRPEHIQQLRQTILNLAVQGKLVSQESNDEPVSTLLERIADEQRNLLEHGLLKKRSVLCDAQDLEAPHSIPAEWHWECLGKLISFGPQNGISPKPTNNEESPKALTLTATTSGFFDPTHYKHVESREADCENYWLSPGDVIFQRGNTREYVGIAAVFNGPERSFVFPDLMIRVRFSESLHLRFVHMVLISPPLRNYFAAKATGASSSMPKISQGVLLNAPIPLPPLAEQHRIVAKVDKLMALCDELEARLTTSARTRFRLLEAVLHEALSRHL